MMDFRSGVPADRVEWTYVVQTSLQILELAFLDDKVVLIVQIFHNVVMSLFVVLEDHGFD